MDTHSTEFVPQHRYPTRLYIQQLLLMGMLGAFFLFGLLYWKNSEIRFLRQDYFHPLINGHTAHPLLQ